MQVRACSFRPLTNNSVQPHQHEFIEWHYVLDGRCGFLRDGERHELEAGDLFAIPPGETHGVHIQGHKEWLLQYIISTDVHDELMRHWHTRFGNHGHTNIGTGRHALFARLDHFTSSNDPFLRTAAGHQFSALLYTTLAGDQSKDDRHPVINQSLGIMRANLRTRLSLDDIANSIHLDKHYFSRLFTNHIGEAPMTHYTNLKMELAAALLRADNDTIESIAASLGYHDPFYFSRVFKRWSGLSPRTWRQRQH